MACNFCHEVFDSRPFLERSHDFEPDPLRECYESSLELLPENSVLLKRREAMLGGPPEPRSRDATSDLRSAIFFFSETKRLLLL